jgi:hypothetical protein
MRRSSVVLALVIAAVIAAPALAAPQLAPGTINLSGTPTGSGASTKFYVGRLPSSVKLHFGKRYRVVIRLRQDRLLADRARQDAAQAQPVARCRRPDVATS